MIKRTKRKSIKTDIETIIIIGTYTNACSIVWGLREIGFSGKIVMIDPNVEDAKNMAEVIITGVVCIKKRIEELNSIVDLVNSIETDDGKRLILMTAEEFIEPIRIAIESGKLKNTISYTGSGVDNDIIFDRLKFYRFVEGLHCVDTPKTIDSDSSPEQTFGTEYVIRVKKSWEGNRKLPRLEIVHSTKEAEDVEKRFIKQGLTRDMWCYQELLSTRDTHNISVCGWYDSRYHQFVVTRKVLQHPPKTGNGDVVETFSEAPEQLVRATEMILKELQYNGAFEMEFVFDENTNKYKIIELNPRFWMQHGLVEEVTDYSLLRRAIGLEDIRQIPISQIEHRYWINGLQALYRIAKGQFFIWRYIRQGTCYPSLFLSAIWAMHYRKYKKAMINNE